MRVSRSSQARPRRLDDNFTTHCLSSPQTVHMMHNIMKSCCGCCLMRFPTNCAGLCWRPAEQYLREVWPAVTRALKEHGVACELNLVRLDSCHSA